MSPNNLAAFFMDVLWALSAGVLVKQLFNFDRFVITDNIYVDASTRKIYISLIFDFLFITQFGIRSHYYTACVYTAWNGKFKPCGFISWKNYISADRTRSTALQRAYMDHPRCNLCHSCIPSYNPILTFDPRSFVKVQKNSFYMKPDTRRSLDLISQASFSTFKSMTGSGWSAFLSS